MIFVANLCNNTKEIRPLTQHITASRFVLVNTEHADFPIVYVSDEFLNFWKYSRKQVFTWCKDEGFFVTLMRKMTASVVTYIF